MENHEREHEVTPFWKKNSNLVPGRPNQVNIQPVGNSKCNPTIIDFKEKENNSKEPRAEGLVEFGESSNQNRPEKETLNLIDLKDSKIITCTCDRTIEPSISPAKINNCEVHNSSKMTKGVTDGAVFTRQSKFNYLLGSSPLNLEDLRLLSWTGIPMDVRPITWRILAGYLPTTLDRRPVVMEQKRFCYWNLVKQYLDKWGEVSYKKIYKQIQVDVPRMSPQSVLFQQQTVQQMFQRMLFIWAIRHPSSGYVQGINDLVTPFYIVFLTEFLPTGVDISDFEVNSLPKKQLEIIEADCFWCFSKFINAIQENYIFAQVGIQRQVNQLKELVQRVDSSLHEHLLKNGVDYLQFSYRWVNNLLTREIPLHCSIRLWDTYLAESSNFASFHLYVCAAFLLFWKKQLLQEQDFQGLLIMLQNLPTKNWTNSHIEVILAEAYRLKYLFSDAPNHLQTS